jgi:oligoendopeptidase F
MPSLQLLDYSTANSIEHFIQYYTFFSTVGLLMNIVRFFFYNFVSRDNKTEEVRQLKEEVENLHNVLEEVVKFLNRNRNNYDEEKAEELWSDDEKEKEKAQAEPPTEEKKIN